MYYLFHCKAHKERSCVLYFLCLVRVFDKNCLTQPRNTCYNSGNTA
ncbi:hypothetical protein RUMCAL_01306 [Ruminococcus callidus ATCC 27760]|uniref:Uncharacterized protein n=1 Tax=Ruminococcus callidus ATCC 27760 TaxID=411473 RepID=U2KW64_9FIRM|nr:hypothetical protein RUMCAL_01306 [Ruminococcus callidus ATCC 27760]